MAKKTSNDGKHAADVPITMVRDPKTGELLPLRGYGALKGQYVVREGVDLTKPIAEQAAELERRERGNHNIYRSDA